MATCEVKCENSAVCAAVPTPAVGDSIKSREGFLRRLFGLLSALLSWSFMISIWVGALALPLVLLAAVVAQQWQWAGVLVGLFLWPHLLPISALPYTRDFLFASMKHWQGPPGTCRFLDLSGEEGCSEPEPEPAPGPGSAKSGKARQMYCYHPHGILSVGALMLLEQVPDLRCCGGPFLYHCSPLFRFGMDGLLGVKFGSVRPADLHGYMKKGETPLMLVPGGFHEATISCPGHERVFLKNRKGFVKYALRYGYDLVPVYTIGESDLAANVQGGWGWRFFLNNLGIPAVLPWGCAWLPLFPRRGVELVTAVGPAVKMPKIERPTNEEVSEHHARYVKEVQKLYERMKVGTASEGRKLEVW